MLKSKGSDSVKHLRGFLLSPHRSLSAHISAGSVSVPAEPNSIAVADQNPNEPPAYTPPTSSLAPPQPRSATSTAVPSIQPPAPPHLPPLLSRNPSPDDAGSASTSAPRPHGAVVSSDSNPSTRILEEEGEAQNAAATLSTTAASRPDPKRRRRGSMLAELGKGEGSSARSSHSASNGSRASGGNPPAIASTSTTAKAHSGTMHSSKPNGGGPTAGRPATYFGHNREEVTRILIQALHDLGYHAAADNIGEESGFEVESPDVAAFREAVLNGSWSKAEELLCGDRRGSRGAGQAAAGRGLVLAPGADRNTMRFRLRQQKFLELLELRDTGRALAVLRNELTPLCQEQHHTLQALSRLLMCQDAEDLKSRASWDGANGQSRQILLTVLSESISPSVMLPDHRLAVLLDGLKQSQIERCRYHTDNVSPSLCVDHLCDRNRFPTEVVAELFHPTQDPSSKRTDEVWQIRFSPNGKHLASCGIGEAVNIWDVERLTLLRQLRGHQKAGVGSLAWSPDSKYLVTCSFDHTAKLWNIETGECLRALNEVYEEPVSGCAWAADSQSFVTGSFDKQQSLRLWNLRGDCLHTWPNAHRTEDLALSPDQRWLVAMDEQCNIHIYNFLTREHLYDLALRARASSVNISSDSRFVLVNKADGQAVLIDLKSRETIQTYKGHLAGNFTIRSNFGGADENFVISGSEDGRVLIWHKLTGVLVHEAEAHHPASCNVVVWNPTNPFMFATAGDDGKVKMYVHPSLLCPASEG
ncbi:WD40-repeat-containing domain protein [Dichotomopilus funicola]|uniref:WD40-repeat-containing domain protein n=1 Tax=Dichotomopilus funicola TaxID=1934379 RepID=A0AAN6VBX2_9PEZI|nr:WD40-repeat-containing domain protein [Dichotomopilus funicola]